MGNESKPESKKFLEAYVDVVGEAQRACPKAIREDYTKMLAAFPELALADAYSLPEQLFEMWADFQFDIFRRAQELPRLPGVTPFHLQLVGENPAAIAAFVSQALAAIAKVKERKAAKMAEKK